MNNTVVITHALPRIQLAVLASLPLLIYMVNILNFDWMKLIFYQTVFIQKHISVFVFVLNDICVIESDLLNFSFDSIFGIFLIILSSIILSIHEDFLFIVLLNACMISHHFHLYFIFLPDPSSYDSKVNIVWFFIPLSCLSEYSGDSSVSLGK